MELDVFRGVPASYGQLSSGQAMNEEGEDLPKRSETVETTPPEISSLEGGLIMHVAETVLNLAFLELQRRRKNLPCILARSRAEERVLKLSEDLKSLRIANF